MDLFENCRICLSEINHEPIKMPRQILRFLQHSLLLKNVTKASPNENEKQNLCAACFNRTSEFQDFFEQCKDADEFWKKQFEEKPNQLKYEENVYIPYEVDSSCLEADTTVSESKDKNDNSRNPENKYEQTLEFEENEKICEEDEPTHSNDFTSIDLTTWQDESNDHDCKTQKNSNEYVNVKNVDAVIEFECKFEESEELEIEEISTVDETESIDTFDVDYRSFTYDKVERERARSSSFIPEGTDYVFEESSETAQSTFSLTTSVDENGKVKMIYKCPKCDRSFNRIYDIESHYNIHSGIKPFTCDVCGKSFRQKNILTTHQALHFGKKIECSECGKKFARRSQLILHDRMHRDEKPFECSVDGCVAAFRQRKQLIDHSFIHTGEKNFQCVKCNKLFQTRKRLQDHIYKVHSQHRYRCELCEKAFLKPHMVKHHMLTVHNVEITDVSHLKTLVDVTHRKKSTF